MRLCLPFSSVLSRLSGSNSGVSAVEFALIAPFVIGAGLFATSVSFKILERQKLDSAVISTAYYLEDRVLSGDWEAFQSDGSSGSSSDVISTANLILSDAYKSSARLTVRKLGVYCGCPQSTGVDGELYDDTKPFFTRYEVETAGSREICSTPCSDNSGARILAEIEVLASNTDMFGEPYVLEKRLVTRLR